MSDLIQYSTRGTVGIISVNSPPVNALSHGVRKGISDGLDQAAADAYVKAVVLICEGRTFIAGADITEFSKPMEEPDLNQVIAKLEAFEKPVIAAIHGTALGGGLELSMGCHHRCAVASAKCGQPEVNLGIPPGAGGTQRLPRLAGVEKAVEMIAGGRPISATEGHALGLIDKIIEGNLLDGAVAFAESLPSDGTALRRVRDMDEKVQGVPPEVFDAARKFMAKRMRGFDAPQRCIDLVEASTKLPFDEGRAKEQEVFIECLVSAQSAAQRHIFSRSGRPRKSRMSRRIRRKNRSNGRLCSAQAQWVAVLR